MGYDRLGDGFIKNILSYITVFFITFIILSSCGQSNNTPVSQETPSYNADITENTVTISDGNVILLFSGNLEFTYIFKDDILKECKLQMNASSTLDADEFAKVLMEQGLYDNILVNEKIVTARMKDSSISGYKHYSANELANFLAREFSAGII